MRPEINNVPELAKPGPNPTIVSFNASAVNIYNACCNATSSLEHFERFVFRTGLRRGGVCGM
jgi:hypothetical protein